MSNKPKETNQKHTDSSHIGKLKHQVNNKNHKNNIREIIWSSTIIALLLAVIFVTSLFQFVASEPFSIELAFSKENIILTSMAIIMSFAIAITIEVIRRK